MIGWLQGERIQAWEQGGRHGLVIACAGVGYEVQLTRRDQTSLSGDSCTLWIHQVHREDGSHLYGFPFQMDRDLFRTLIGVNGVGPQVALSLLDSCTAADLVTAIIEGDLKRLTQAQGVGKRTAERIAVELRDRLGAWAPSSEEPALSLVDRSDIQYHVKYVLESTIAGTSAHPGNARLRRPGNPSCDASRCLGHGVSCRQRP